jgi:hypothetical protein
MSKFLQFRCRQASSFQRSRIRSAAVSLGNEPNGYIVVRQIRSQYVSAAPDSSRRRPQESGAKSAISRKKSSMPGDGSRAAFFGAIGQKRKSLPREEVRQAFEKNRTTAGRRSAAVPADDPGRRMGRLHIEGLREEVHRFDRNNHTYFLLSW